MARILPTSTLVFLFTLLTCQMLSAEGRDIKSPNKEGINFINNPSLSSIRKRGSLITQSDRSESPTNKNTPQKTTAHYLQTITRDNKLPSSEPTIILQTTSCSGGKNDYPNVKSFDNKQTTLDCAPGTDHDKKDSETLNRRAALEKMYFPSRSPTPVAFLSASVVSSKNDFRPTTAGLSSGAGHSDVNKINKDESITCLNHKCVGDFPPTLPGDSPGPHPAFANNNDSNQSEQRMHLSKAHTQAGQKDDYRPTAPGHSPGAGHPILKNIRKPNS